MKLTHLAGFAIAGAMLASLNANTANAAAAPAEFQVCAACHRTTAGTNAIGPSLFGVVGRKAGTEPGFNYSPAMKSAGFVWTVKKLTAYIDNPQAVVPHNRMPFFGTHNMATAATVANYLATLK
jgi:cytochrome c2